MALPDPQKLRGSGRRPNRASPSRRRCLTTTSTRSASTTPRGRRLVAAIEIVSPDNKDWPEHRNVFVAKCAVLLQRGVAVSVIDLVTVRQFNLYAELLALIGHADPTLVNPPPALYAAPCRRVEREKRTILETWSHVLALGRPLPTLPVWLSAERALALDLERSYEQACNDLWIP